MVSSGIPALQPSLWRTCRVLANRQRLELLQELFRRPDQTVGVLSTRLRISISMASQYLRQLNARGLLQVRRVGPQVLYRPTADLSVPHARPLLAAIQETFRSRSDPVEFIFRHATALTHPRRVHIVAALGHRPLSMGDLARATGISLRALYRHVDKLVDRGFVVRSNEECRLIEPGTKLGGTLLRMVEPGSP